MLDLGILIVRAALGLVLAAHGAQKLFGWFGGPRLSGTTAYFGSLGLRPARFWAVLVGLAETGGGLLLALGLLGPVAPALILAEMIGAAWLVHRSHGFWASAGGIEWPALVGTVALGLALTGFGRYALDREFGFDLREPVYIAVAFAVGILGTLIAVATTRRAARPVQAPAGA